MSSSHSVSCRQCGLNRLCIPKSLTLAEVEEVDSIIKRGKPLRRGEYLYRIGDSFDSLFAVRSGSIKVFTVTPQGREQVIGFYLPGEFLGMDAIDSAAHTTTARAMETSTVCEVPYADVDSLSTSIHNLQIRMYKLLSREIRIDHERQMLLGKSAADERIGAFLMNLSMRHARRHLSESKFRLPMTRSDIGNYLGLAVETISRILSRLQAQGILTVSGKEIEILDHNALCRLSHSTMHRVPP